MYAATTHVDKQSFPFSDVLRACFYEIANHAKINIGRRTICILFLALPAPTLMSAVHLSKEDTTRGRIRSVHIFTVHEHSSSVNTELKPASECQIESFYNHANQVTLLLLLLLLMLCLGSTRRYHIYRRECEMSYAYINIICINEHVPL